MVAAAVGTIYGVQLVSRALGASPLLGSSISDLAVLAALFAFAHRRRISAADLGLRRAPARFIVAAVLLGSSMWCVTAWLVQLIGPPGEIEGLQKLVERDPLALTLIALSLLPALAEEVLFRGVLVRSLAARFRVGFAIVLSAATFGVYHLFLPQVVSTFVLGLVLALLAIRARSIVPSIIVHLLNNAIAIVLAREEIPALNTWMTDYPAITLSGAVVLAGCGIALGAKGIAESSGGADAKGAA